MQPLIFSFGCLLLCGCAVMPAEQTSPVVSAPVVPAAPVVSPAPVPKKKQHPKFAPAYKPVKTDPFTEAEDIYESCSNVPQGVYRFHGLVFVVVVIGTNREKVADAEASSMFRANALLRRHFPRLNARFSAPCRVLENAMDFETDIYRYVLVYREADLQRCFLK